jgi:prepilin-type N-terminal cleavage/methylation domain-containing protein
MQPSNGRGMSLLEALVVLALISFLAALAAPSLRAYSVEAHLLGAGRTFKVEFLKARSMAVRSSVYTAIRFETDEQGFSYSLYADGNGNGVRSIEIASGIDRKVAGPFPLDAHAPGVRVGINDGVPAPPPETGILDTGDPIRFGNSNMLSFSPLGTATPGTFYLAGEGIQAAVRVTGTSARVRLMICRGKKWVER